MIEFAMANSGSRGHALNIAWTNDGARTETVLVLKSAVEHVGNNLHIAMALRPKSCARLNSVFVDYTQRPKAHVLRVIVVCERETVKTIKPAVVLMTARLS